MSKEYIKPQELKLKKEELNNIIELQSKTLSELSIGIEECYDLLSSKSQKSNDFISTELRISDLLTNDSGETFNLDPLSNSVTNRNTPKLTMSELVTSWEDVTTPRSKTEKSKMSILIEELNELPTVKLFDYKTETKKEITVPTSKLQSWPSIINLLEPKTISIDMSTIENLVQEIGKALETENIEN
jgi:hypothetical protein